MSQSRPTRRRQRRQERLFALSVTSLFLIFLGIGIGVALYLSWAVFPLNDVVASPALFRQDFKDDYIYMVAQAYAADRDWDRAQERLALLNDPNLPDTVLIQVEAYLREGRPVESVRHLADLAQELGATGGALALFGPTPAATEAIEAPTTLTSTPTSAAIIVVTATPDLILETPEPSPTSAALAVTLTPSPTVVPNFTLLSQRQLCQAGLDQPMIEVEVVDRDLNPIRGIELLVSWEEEGFTRQDRFVTGFKPGESEGYGDFTMESDDVSYTVQLVDGSLPVSGLTIEPCEDGSGNAGWRLRFREN